MSIRSLRSVVASIALSAAVCLPGNAQSLSTATGFFEEIADIYLNLEGKEQAQALEELLSEAEAYRERHPDKAEACLVTGLIRAGIARNRGISALGLMKQVRRDFDKALELDGKALEGYGPAFLGRLYFVAPGWPVSFGDDDTAKEFFAQAKAINDSTIEYNYYFALFLADQKKYQQAYDHLQIAKQTAPDPDRPQWEKYLRTLVSEELDSISANLE